MAIHEVCYLQPSYYKVLSEDRSERLNAGMSFQTQYSSELLLQIAEQLDSGEKEEILYLCCDYSSVNNVRDLFDELKENNLLQPIGLVELLYHVKRFDLLKRYLHLSRRDAELFLNTNDQIVTKYRVLMVEINGQLEESDFDSLCFLLKNKVTNVGKLQNKTFLSLVTELEKRNLLGPDKVDLLEGCLQTIQRMDLKSKLLKYKQADQKAFSSHYINAIEASPSPQRAFHHPAPITRQMNENHDYKGTVPVQESGASCLGTGDRYVFTHNPAGVCLIFDCVGNDADLLEKTFTSMSFNVMRFMYVTISDLDTTLMKVSKMEELKSYDLLVCFLISRGSSDSVFCIDEGVPGYSFDKVKTFFTGHSCPSLVGKPKLFFIQNYLVKENMEAGNDDLIVEDGPSTRNPISADRIYVFPKIPNEADIFWSLCKVDENELQRRPSSPSPYLQNLIQLIGDRRTSVFTVVV
ncbi:CASP8 and FADD-like apoptosis regulator isoform X2 [Bombina bombina]|uniref:CASP8 and FADD-like apoptosis regulator isoform X2 n=1 Tax=Bombina bombina TaxID=8345 RepID=UPI00235A5091|nr:CASP8 and FADD-like apoptosis regulator isoform X2 [Bombina bombina]